MLDVLLSRKKDWSIPCGNCRFGPIGFISALYYIMVTPIRVDDWVWKSLVLVIGLVEFFLRISLITWPCIFIIFLMKWGAIGYQNNDCMQIVGLFFYSVIGKVMFCICITSECFLEFQHSFSIDYWNHSRWAYYYCFSFDHVWDSQAYLSCLFFSL